MNCELASALFDPLCLSLKLNLNAKLATSGDELIDQIGVESWKGPSITMHNCDLRSNPRRHVAELRLETPDAAAEYEVGQELTAEIFADGSYVDVTGTSKGKGFAGTMKRHGFRGQGASHGAQAVHRRPGSIGGCSTPARVFKGTRMSGRMGNDRVTAQNLLVHKVDAENGVLLIKGAVPGRTGGLVMVRSAIKRGDN